MTDTMIVPALTAAQIKAMRPDDSDLSDAGENRGLRVACGKGGRRTFFYRYRSPVTGKVVQMKLGLFPSISLSEARVELKRLKELRNSGVCPSTKAKEETQAEKRARNRDASRLTVKQLVNEYLKNYIEDRTLNGKLIPGARKRKGQSETRRTLYGDAVRVLGERYADEITRKDVVDLVMEIVGRGSNVQAGNVLRELSSAYEFSIGLGKFADEFVNPALLAKSSLRQAKIKLTSNRGRRVLSDKELGVFLRWLPGSVFTPTQKNILRFTLWTGCRTGEVCTAKWCDIDLKTATWHLKDTKTGVERYVQLPQQALDFLKQLTLTTGDYPFPSQKTGLPIQQKSITEQAWQLRSTGRMVAIDHWSPHDLRRTVRTGLSRLRCPSEVAEAIVGHARSGIEGTYDLHSYENESREWLQKWADHIENLVI